MPKKVKPFLNWVPVSETSIPTKRGRYFFFCNKRKFGLLVDAIIDAEIVKTRGITHFVETDLPAYKTYNKPE